MINYRFFLLSFSRVCWRLPRYFSPLHPALHFPGAKKIPVPAESRINCIPKKIPARWSLSPDGKNYCEPWCKSFHIFSSVVRSQTNFFRITRTMRKYFYTITPERKILLQHPEITSKNYHFSDFTTSRIRARIGLRSPKIQKQSPKWALFEIRSPPVRSKTPGYFVWTGGPEIGMKFTSVSDGKRL